MRISDWSSDVCSSDLVHRAIVDHRHAGRRDALTDAARKGARALAVEIAFKPVADSLVKQHAGPAGAEQHGEFARGGIDRAQIDERLGQRFVARAVPLRGFDKMSVHITAAEAALAAPRPPLPPAPDTNVQPH